MPYCPCGTGKTYNDCCGRFITGQESPSTPEELMRSRYTAYNQMNFDYIIKTMKSPAADDFDAKAAKESGEKTSWLKLEIVRTTSQATHGVVEFRAHYHSNGKKYILHEISEFSFENGKWYYVNGTQPNNQLTADTSKKIGRNDKCPCGSNKKYKKCCGISSC